MPTPSLLQNHPDYPVLKNWAHRKSVVLVRPPAVMQHLGHWIPRHFIFNRQAWLAEIDGLIKEIHNQLSTNTECTDYKCSEIKSFAADSERKRRHYTQRFQFHWNSASVEMSLELQEEFFTLSTHISLYDWEDKNDQEANSVSELAKNLRMLNKAMTERYGDLIAGKAEASGFEKHVETLKSLQINLEHANYVIYKQIWRGFDEKVLAGLFTRPEVIEARKSKIGERFADIRGLLINRLWDEKEGAAASFPKTSFIAEPGEASRLLPVYQSKSPPAFENGESARCANTLLPFLSAGGENVEHTFSLLLNGRCIHATALGALPQERADTEEPITYMMLSTGSNRWQMGRLIDRIHTLGTLRLSALYDLPRISVASDKLREVERDLDPLKNGLPLLVNSGGAKIDEIFKVASQLFGLSKRMAEIDKGFDSGLLYRIEHFRFYRQQFDDIITSLRIDQAKRIDDFQPYDKFIRRRLGDVYDFIEMTGTQYARIQASVEGVNQQLRTIESLESLGQGTRQHKLTEEHADKVKTLQKAAGLFAWGILFPYFFTQIVLGIFDSAQCPRVLFGFREMPLRYLVGVTALGYGLWRGWGLIEPFTKSPVKNVWFCAQLVVVCGAIVLAGCLSGVLPLSDYTTQHAMECQAAQATATAQRNQDLKHITSRKSAPEKQNAAEGITVVPDKTPAETWINPKNAASNPPASAAPRSDATGTMPHFPELPPVMPPSPPMPQTSGTASQPAMLPPVELASIQPQSSSDTDTAHSTPEELGLKELVLPPIKNKKRAHKIADVPSASSLPTLAPAAGDQKLLNIVGDKPVPSKPCLHSHKALPTDTMGGGTQHKKHGNCYTQNGSDIVTYSADQQ